MYFHRHKHGYLNKYPLKCVSKLTLAIEMDVILSHLREEMDQQSVLYLAVATDYSTP